MIYSDEKELIFANKLFGKNPKKELKAKVMFHFQNLSLEKEFDLENPPLITYYSDLQSWILATKHILLPDNEENIFLHTLRENEKVHQFVGYARFEIPDEEHDDIQESFLILEGTCRCMIGDKTFEFAAGDYFELPLDTVHNVLVTSEMPLKAVLQRIML